MSREAIAATIAEVEGVVRDYLDIPLCPTQFVESFTYQGADSCYAAPFLRRRQTGWGRAERALRLPKYELSRCPAYFLGELMHTLVGEYEVNYYTDMGSSFCDPHDWHAQPPAQMTSYPVYAEIIVPLDELPSELDRCNLSLYFAESEAPDAIEPESSYRLQCDGTYTTVGTLCLDRTKKIDPLKSVRIVQNVPDGDEVLPFPALEPYIRVAIIQLDPWLLIKPKLFDRFPQGCHGACPIDGTEMENYVGHVRVVYSWFDQSAPAVEFIWEPRLNNGCGCGRKTCDVCKIHKRPGCLVEVGEHGCGDIMVAPACYDPEKGWCEVSFNDCGCGSLGNPDKVNIKYWHGYTDHKCGELKRKHCDPTCINCPSLEWAITALVVARMPKPLCACTCGNSDGHGYRWPGGENPNMLKTTDDNRFYVPEEIALNKLGTTELEVAVWRRLELVKERMCKYDKAGDIALL